MIGYISANLKVEIKRYFVSTNTKCLYELNEFINDDNMELVINDINRSGIRTLILDGTSFSEHVSLKKFIEKTRNISIIYIAFSQVDLNSLSNMGIYNTFIYSKRKDFVDSISQIIKNPKTKQVINVKDLSSIDYENCYLSISVDYKTYATSFWLEYCKLNKSKKICFIEIRSSKSQLYYYHEQGGSNEYTIGNTTFISSTIDNINKEQLALLMLKVSPMYDIVILDCSYSAIGHIGLLIPRVDGIYVFDNPSCFDIKLKEGMLSKLIGLDNFKCRINLKHISKSKKRNRYYKKLIKKYLPKEVPLFIKILKTDIKKR